MNADSRWTIGAFALGLLALAAADWLAARATGEFAKHANPSAAETGPGAEPARANEASQRELVLRWGIQLAAVCGLGVVAGRTYRRLAAAKAGEHLLESLQTRVDEQGRRLNDAEAAWQRECAARCEAESALHRSEAAYRELLENYPDAWLILGEDRIEFANPACVELFAATNQPLLGRTPLEIIHPECHSPFTDWIRPLRGPTTAAPVTRQRIVRCDGAVVEVDALAVALANRNPAAVLIGFRRPAVPPGGNPRLERLGLAVRKVAHEMSNAMAPILMAVDLLKVSRDEQSRQRMLGTAKEGVDRAIDLVQRLRAFAMEAECDRGERTGPSEDGIPILNLSRRPSPAEAGPRPNRLDREEL